MFVRVHTCFAEYLAGSEEAVKYCTRICSVLSSGPTWNSKADIFHEALTHRLKALDSIVGNRPDDDRRLKPADESHVRAISNALVLMVTEGRPLTWTLAVDEVCNNGKTVGPLAGT